MYVPFGKSVDDVTFRLSLHQLFCPRLKKTMEHNPRPLQFCYCKRGYFRWGEILQKCWQDISRGGNFHDTAHISFIKAYGFNFRVGVIFAKKTKAQQTRKLPPHENFHVYSNAMFVY